MSTPAQPNAYLKTKVLTASPAELRMMLFDGALRFGDQARTAMVERRWEQVYEGLTRCQAILMELINGLRPEHDPTLCRNLTSLYTFMYTRLIDASQERDVAMIDEVLELLRYERETWVMLMDGLTKENAAAAGMTGTPTSSSRAGSQADPARMVGGRVSLSG